MEIRYFMKIFLMCAFNLFFIIPSYISHAYASVDIFETMASLRNISLPLLFISIIILFYCLVRLLEYRRVISKKSEELRESEERFRTFFENGPEYCYMISPDEIILDVNKAALKALGYKIKDFVVQRGLVRD